MVRCWITSIMRLTWSYEEAISVLSNTRIGFASALQVLAVGERELVGTGGFEPPSMIALTGSPPSHAFSGTHRLRRCASSWGARGRRVRMLVGTGGFEPPSMLALPGSPPSHAFSGTHRLRRCAS